MKPGVLAIWAGLLLTFGLPSPATGTLAYDGCFRSRDLVYDFRPSVLFTGIAADVAGTNEVGRPTAYWVDVLAVTIGEVTDPFWIGAEDSSHFPRFAPGDTIVVARWGTREAVPVTGTSDIAGCAWVVGADGLIDYDRSPAVHGDRPATVGELLSALAELPDTAVGHTRPNIPGVAGAIFLLLSVLAAAAPAVRRMR